MFDRLAAAAAVAVVAIGGITLGYSLITRPDGPAAGPCPTSFREADAVDTSVPGLTQSQRAWGIAGGAPGRVRPALVAGFDPYSPGTPQSVVTIDPATGARCRLVAFVDAKIIQEHYTQLDWSPSGDALAIGLENPEPQQEGDPPSTGQVLIWTPNRLVRVWSALGQQPGVEWAPDGRSIAVWMAVGAENPPAVQIIFADGSPTRDINVRPTHLKWSPDGSRWIVSQFSWPTGQRPRNDAAVVNVADGRVTPVDMGIQSLVPVGWIDDQHLLLDATTNEADEGYIVAPLSALEGFSVVNLPAEALEPDVFIAFSPDGRHAAYVTADGDLEIADITAEPGDSVVHVDVDGGFSPGLAWAPDGSQVIFTQLVATSGSIGTYATRIVNLDGTGLRQIALGGFWTMDDPWQPVALR